MHSLTELYRIGHGPSSSHTMGPQKAAEAFATDISEADRFRVTLFGSLAATGKGHLTDRVLLQTLGEDRTAIDWRPETVLPEHPNAFEFQALNDRGEVIATRQAYSIGGGAVRIAGEPERFDHVYELTSLMDIIAFCEERNIPLWHYVEECENGDLWPFLQEIWAAMQAAVQRGLQTEGVLPGSIGLRRKAAAYLRKAQQEDPDIQRTGIITAYALAVSEENAAAGVVVTAPTCGSAGVIPAVLSYLQETKDITTKQILRGLATAGLVGNIIKHNASISGAEVGCQGEVGAACAMAAAAAAQILDGTVQQIEYAAEMGLEHHLGLTCDPVDGLVQIPCIERNACAAARALDLAHVAILSDGSHHIPFDEVVQVMKQTGHDLPSLYRETSTGGLAKFYGERRRKNT